MDTQLALFDYCLRLGDDALIQSYRLSEWCSNAPTLEEDLALTNFALDMTGRAQVLLGYAGQIEGKGRTADDLAYKRAERRFRNHLITELPNGDFAFTILRMFFMSSYEYFFYTALQKSGDATLSALAVKTLKEVKYHMTHSRDWVLRLGAGTEESHNRCVKALERLWPFTGELFDADSVDRAMTEVGIGVDVFAIKREWEQQVHQVLIAATLEVAPAEGHQRGGNEGVHTEYLGHILSEMQYLQRAYPEAIW